MYIWVSREGSGWGQYTVETIVSSSEARCGSWTIIIEESWHTRHTVTDMCAITTQHTLVNLTLYLRIMVCTFNRLFNSGVYSQAPDAVEYKCYRYK